MLKCRIGVHGYFLSDALYNIQHATVLYEPAFIDQRSISYEKNMRNLPFLRFPEGYACLLMKDKYDIIF